MIDYWLIPALIVFVLILWVARNDECQAKDLKWHWLLGTVIIWPIGAAALLWLLYDFLTTGRRNRI